MDMDYDNEPESDKQDDNDNQANISLSTEDIRALVEKRREEEAAKLLNGVKEPKSGMGVIDSKFVLDCLYMGDVGDGILYSTVMNGKYVFLNNEKTPCRYNGQHWEYDIGNFSLADTENVAKRYLDETINIAYKMKEISDQEELAKFKKIQNKLYAKASRLRTKAGREKCLSCAFTNNVNPLTVDGSEIFDLDPWVIAFKNGVVNLKTGEIRPGKPEDYILRATPHEWKGINEPCPNFEKFLNTIFMGNQDLISFLQRLLGYSITGLTNENIFVVFYGQGRNGKSVLIEICFYILGPLASPIQSEMLLDQGRSRSSGGPSPDIMTLRGLRLAVASETDEDRKFSSSKVKWLSGSDTICARNPHATYETSFRPTHKLFLLTNNKPHAAAYDYALWERMFLIPFPLSFVNRTPRADNERKADKYLYEKLKKEAPGISAWLVRGCIAWQERGLDPPPIILDATAEYKREEDILQEYLDECCYLDPEARVSASALYDNFSDWFARNVSKKGLSQKKFGKLLRKAGFDKVKSAIYTYIGIGLIVE